MTNVSQTQHEHYTNTIRTWSEILHLPGTLSTQYKYEHDTATHWEPTGNALQTPDEHLTNTLRTHYEHLMNTLRTPCGQTAIRLRTQNTWHTDIVY